MKRYKFDMPMTEDPDGAYVKYEDVAKLILKDVKHDEHAFLDVVLKVEKLAKRVKELEVKNETSLDNG